MGWPSALCLGGVLAVAVASDCRVPSSLIETVRGYNVLRLAATAIGR
jgi:hypothetical protein